MATVVNPSRPFHRKPVPSHAQTNAFAPSQTAAQQHQQQQQTSSYPLGGTSNTIGSPAYSTLQAPQVPQPPQSHYPPQSSRRTLSNATSSTSSTGIIPGVPRPPPSNAYAGSIRRSTSSRSTASASPTSYVALMRKQKATVWCDRAQHQDPRILAAQRQAKMRAAMEVAGGHNHNPQARAITSSSGIAGGVRSKIRHHGAPKAKDYNAGNLSGAGVPMRLSASEVDEGDSDEEVRYHQRNGSGRSSLGSGPRAYGQHPTLRGHSNDSTPSNAVSPVESMGDLMEEATPMPHQYGQSNDYFAQQGGSGGSGSSGEGEASFGSVGGLPQTRARADSEHVTSEELRRRGSVDDRTMTMSAGRLFVANPDLSD